MFNNFSATVVQAIGFFGIFSFFVFQLLSDKSKTSSSVSNPTKTPYKERKESKIRSFFNRGNKE